MKNILQSNYKNYFLGGLMVYIITAIFSGGWFHPDEHFQILEFCNYKLGKIAAIDMVWEFQEKIRPATQPFLLFLFTKLLSIFTIENPFIIVLLLRLIMGILTWYVVCLFCIQYLQELKNQATKKLLLILVFFVWFMPLISVRFSSENFSNLFFLIAVYLIQFKNKQHKNFTLFICCIGFLLAISFYSRFQMGFAIFGLACWILFNKKYTIAQYVLIFLFFLLGIAICMYIDYWFYGSFVCTPYRYFYANIIQHKAANFGVYPWWYYITLFIQKGIPPIAIVLLLFFFSGFLRLKKHIYFYILCCFYGFHFIIGHKEMRFLFPLVLFFLYFVAKGVDVYVEKKWGQRFMQFIFKFCLSINIILLFYIMFIPTNIMSANFKFIYNYAKNEKIILLTTEKEFYTFDNYLKISFYKSNNVQPVFCKNDSAKFAYLKIFKPAKIIIVENSILTNTNYAGYHSNTIYQTLPTFVLNYNFNNWLSRIDAIKMVQLDLIK